MAEIFDLELDGFLDTFDFLGINNPYSVGEMPDVDFENDVRCSCEQLITKVSSRAEKLKSQEKHLEAAQKMFTEKIRGVNERMSEYRKSLDKDYKEKCKVLEEKQLQLDSLKEEQETRFQTKIDHLEEEKQNLKKKMEAFEGEKQSMERKMEALEDEKQKLERKMQAFEEERQNMDKKVKDFEEKRTTKKDAETQECIIKLDVGGHRFTTSLNTLCKDQNSMVAIMFSGRHNLFKSDDGSYFIDRDGTYFQYILNYLRGGIVSPEDLPDDPYLLTALRRESDFYQIRAFTELIEECLETPGVKLDYSQEEITRMLSTLVWNDDSKDSHNDVTESSKYSNGTTTVGHCMTKCKLSFTNKRLHGISFAHTTFLHDVSFRNARLVGASFYGCEFRIGVQINFNYSDLTDCDFRQCKGKENGAKRNFAHGGGLLSVSSSETFLQMVQEGRITFKRAKIENTLFDSKVLDYLNCQKIEK